MFSHTQENSCPKILDLNIAYKWGLALQTNRERKMNNM